MDQNNKLQIERLAAQRQLYSTAKNILIIQMILGGPLALATVVIAILFPCTKSLMAIWGIFIFYLDYIFLTPQQKKLRKEAAKIQEVFDCEIFGLNWNYIKIGKQCSIETIKEQAAKYKEKKKILDLKNWYPPIVFKVPMYIGRIICQRSNIHWDSAQRRYYAGLILILISLIFFGSSIIAILLNFTLSEFILSIINPLLPMMYLGLRQYNDHKEAANRLDYLKDNCDHMWEYVLKGEKESELLIKARALQDEIFESRSKNIPVFDFIFKRFRKGREKIMRKTAEEMIAEIEKIKFN